MDSERKNNQQFFDAPRPPPLSSYKVSLNPLKLVVRLSIRVSQSDQLDQGSRVVLIRCSCTDLPQCGPDGLRDTSQRISIAVLALKTKCISPYLFNAGLFHRARLLRSISSEYAHTLASHAAANLSFQFDILFLRTKAFHSPRRPLINLWI
jgi:hypothetical protein